MVRRLKDREHAPFCPAARPRSPNAPEENAPRPVRIVRPQRSRATVFGHDLRRKRPDAASPRAPLSLPLVSQAGPDRLFAHDLASGSASFRLLSNGLAAPQQNTARQSTRRALSQGYRRPDLILLLKVASLSGPAPYYFLFR